MKIPMRSTSFASRYVGGEFIDTYLLGKIGWIGVVVAMIGLSGCVAGRNAGPIHEELWQENSCGKIERALRAGADVNQEDERGRTPLYMEALKGDLPAVRLLVAHKAALTKGDRLGSHRTALHAAAEMGHTAVVSFLLESGIDPNVRDDFGITPLHLAAWMEHPEAVRALLLAGAKPAMRCKGQRTPINGIGAYRKGNENDYAEVIGLLLKAGLGANTTEDDGTTPLLDACAAGATNVVALLLGKGANVNAKRRTGFTGLMIASDIDSPELADMLIKAGADTSVRNSEGLTALEMAIRGGHEKVVTLLRAANHSR